MNERALRIVLPILVLALIIACWHAVVQIFAIPPFVLPGPGLVLATLIADGPLLWQSLLVTLTLTFQGFLLAAVGGIALALAAAACLAARLQISYPQPQSGESPCLPGSLQRLY